MTSCLIISYLPTLFHSPGVLLNKELIWCGLSYWCTNAWTGCLWTHIHPPPWQNIINKPIILLWYKAQKVTHWSVVGLSNHSPSSGMCTQMLLVDYRAAYACTQTPIDDQWLDIPITHKPVSTSTRMIDSWWLDIPNNSCTTEHAHLNDWLSI